jgi:hypothetical protein
MNAVYPYIHSTGSELVYSLRSLEKHTDLEPVVIGDKPDWYKGRHIPFPASTRGADSSYKITNVYFKIRRACLDKKISDTFLYMNDDIYLIEKPKKVHYVNGRIEDLWQDYQNNHGESYYTRCLQRTVEYVGTSWNYETHTPMWIGKDFLYINPDVFVTDPMLYRTVYGATSKMKVINIGKAQGAKKRSSTRN